MVLPHNEYNVAMKKMAGSRLEDLWLARSRAHALCCGLTGSQKHQLWNNMNNVTTELGTGHWKNYMMIYSHVRAVCILGPICNQTPNKHEGVAYNTFAPWHVPQERQTWGRSFPKKYRKHRNIEKLVTGRTSAICVQTGSDYMGT